MKIYWKSKGSKIKLAPNNRKNIYKMPSFVLQKKEKATQFYFLDEPSLHEQYEYMKSQMSCVNNFNSNAILETCPVLVWGLIC